MEQRATQVRSDIAKAASGSGLRVLSSSELDQLKQQGNQCEDEAWSDVIRVAGSCDLSRIRGCWFGGKVVIGALGGQVAAGRGLPSELLNTGLRDCWIGDGARVSNCELVEKTWIGAGASLSRCGVITKGSKNLSFGNGGEIPVVIGNGGREVFSYADLELEEACAVAVHRGDSKLQEAYKAKVDGFVQKVSLPWNVIEPCAKLESASYLSNVFIGSHAWIDSSRLEDSTVLSSEAEASEVRGGSDVRGSILQYQVSVDSQSVVFNSVMCPCSHAERHGKLLDSILGPYSGVAEGEISESLVGPFVGFHHQALLIASYWPAGRGNIGYGGNVGSNHTGKAPDQELWHGEGVFYGLGCCVKFPSDFTRAPYSLIATGVTTLPQRVTFPFSLIAAPSSSVPGLSPAFNEIQPAWVLSQNIYSVLRNEHKFKTRGSKSKRVAVDPRVFRPSTVTMMRLARDALADPSVPEKSWYTDRDFVGLGKNCMSLKARKEAVETYTYFLVYYAVLQGVWARISDGTATLATVATDLQKARGTTYAQVQPGPNLTETGLGVVSKEEMAREWAYQCSILTQEAPSVVFRGTAPPEGVDLVMALLQWLKAAKSRVATLTLNSKLKDEKRGSKMIPGYVDAHGQVASTDAIVRRAFSESYQLADDVDKVLNGPASKL